jgi:Tfp pilus assembly protein PilO
MPPGPGGPGPGPAAGKPAPKTGAADAGKMSFKINLTKEQQNNLAAAVIGTALVVFVYVKYWAMPVMSGYKSKTVILEQKKKELGDARQMVSNYSEFLARTSEISGKSDFINKRLPKDINISETIREITKSATENNINIIKFEPGEELNKGEYKEFAIALNYNTNFKDMGYFLTSIGFLDRLTIPSDMNIQRKGTNSETSGADNLVVNMKIKIYSLAE